MLTIQSYSSVSRVPSNHLIGIGTKSRQNESRRNATTGMRISSYSQRGKHYREVHCQTLRHYG